MLHSACCNPKSDISGLLEGFTKQLLHCMRVMRVCFQQALQTLPIHCCPLLLALISAPSDAPSLLSKL